MGLVHIYCDICRQCRLEDCFRHCAYCGEHFTYKGHSICDECDEDYMKIITFKDKQYKMFFHKRCFLKYNKEQDQEEKESMVNDYGVEV